MNFKADLPADNLLDKKNIYLVGIKGVGMTALAQLLTEAGVKVNGADVEQDFVTAATLHHLRLGIDTFDQATIPGATQVVIYSGAHGGSNHPLVKQAKKNKIPTYSLAQAIGMISQTLQTIAVCGVGGKSTTSAMVAWILQSAGRDPSYAIGVGDVPNLGHPAHLNKESSLFVVEADEYVADPVKDPTPRFLYLRPKHLICTSLIYDHPDVYKNQTETKEAFSRFFSYLEEDSYLVVNGDDVSLRNLAELKTVTKAQVVLVGEKAVNDIHVTVEPDVDGGSSEVTLSGELINDKLGQDFTFRLPIPGFHNAFNAAYAVSLALLLEAKPKKVKGAMSQWRSVQRRFEYKGETTNGVKIFDDYAHHPREIAAIAQTIHRWYPRRSVVVAFEPHTYSRTQVLLDEFVKALSDIPGEIILLPIFSSAREDKSQFDVSSQDVVNALRSVGHNASYLSSYNKLVQYVKKLPAGTLVFTLGAGDIYHAFDHVKLY